MTATMKPWAGIGEKPARCWNFYVDGNCCGFASLAAGNAAWDINYEAPDAEAALKTAPAVRAAFAAKYPDAAYTEWLMQETEPANRWALPGLQRVPLLSRAPVVSHQTRC